MAEAFVQKPKSAAMFGLPLHWRGNEGEVTKMEQG